MLHRKGAASVLRQEKRVSKEDATDSESVSDTQKKGLEWNAFCLE